MHLLKLISSFMIKMYPLPSEMIFNFHLKISTGSKPSGLSKK